MRAGSTAARPWVWLVLAVIALGAAVVVWTAGDRRPPEWDYANHLERALGCHRILAGRAPLGEILWQSGLYPPGALCLAGAAYFVFPATLLTARLLMLAWVAVAMAAVYALGRRLLDAETGLLAAILLAAAPITAVLLLSFQLDVPLMAAVAVALLALARAEAFARAGRSLALGAALAAGMLVKSTFGIYVLPPLAWAAWQAARAPDRRARLLRLAGALALAGGLVLPWYGARLATLPATILYRATASGAEEGDPLPLTAAGLLTYPAHLAYALGPLAAALLVWGVLALWRERAARGFLWAALLLPLAAISLAHNKDLRYLVPVLPAMAVVAAVPGRALSRRARIGLLGLCALAGALQVSMALFGVPSPPPVPGRSERLVMSRPPDPAPWPQRAIVDAIERERGRRPTAVAVVPNHPFFSRSNFSYEIALRALPYRAGRAWRSAPLGIDYVVLKSGAQGPAWTAERPERIARAFAGGDPHLAAVYPVVAEYPLPDGSVAALRVRRVPPLRSVSPAAVARRLESLPARLLDDPLLASHVRDPVNPRVRIAYAPEAILRGEVARATIEADSAVIGELRRRERAPLRVRDARLEIEGLLINPHRLMATGDLEVLDAAAVRVEQLRITEQDLAALLQGQPAGRGLRVELGQGEARAILTRLGPPVALRARLVPGAEDRPLSLVVDELRVAGLPVPTALVNWLVRQVDPTRALRRLPVAVSLAPVRIEPGRIVVGPGGR
jgi:hypothetical protein